MKRRFNNLRQRTRTVYRNAKARVSRSRKNPNSSMNQFLGMVAYGLVKPTLDSAESGLIGRTGMNVPAGAMQLLLAWKLQSKGGIIGNAAKAAYYYNGVNIVSKFTPNLNLGNILGGNTNATTQTTNSQLTNPFN